MLKRNTLVLLIVAAVLGGAVLLFESRDRPEPGETSTGIQQGKGEQILPLQEEAITELKVERAIASSPEATNNGTEELSFEKSEDGSWQMIAPETAIAETGAIAFLLSQATGKATLTFESTSDKLSDFGLDSPTATVDLTAEEQSYQLLIGGSDISGDGVYLLVQDPEQPEEGNGDADSAVQVHVVSGSFLSAVERPVEEWLAASAEEEPTDIEPES